MAHPTWLAWGFAAVMVAVSLYCALRLLLAKRLGRRNHYDVNVSHVLMGVAMAGMLAPSWNVVPDGLWEVVFGFIALWFLALSVRFVARHGIAGTDDDHVHHISHFLIHMVMACAMLYMYWVGTSTSRPGMAMGGSAGSAGDPGLTLLLVTVLLGSAVWQLDAMSRFAPSTQTRTPALAAVGAVLSGRGALRGDVPAERPFLAPRLEIGCHVLMCVTMAYMLILML